MTEKLQEEQIRDVLARAEEIHRQDSGAQSWRDDVDAVLAAAEEAGLPREAVKQAIQERLGSPTGPPEAGQRVFAKSSDGKFYVAHVLETEPKSVKVKFLKGGEITLSPEQVRLAQFLPGEKIECPWPYWGWWSCSIISFNEKSNTVKVSDGWTSTERFSIGDIRWSPPKVRKLRSIGRAKAMLTMYAVGILTGGLLGAFGTWLLLR